MMDYVEKIQEKVDVAHGHRLGMAFATRNKKYMKEMSQPTNMTISIAQQRSSTRTERPVRRHIIQRIS